ncbi:MAG: reverse transcriptase domain-containing protein, partial [Cytophaga sp.]|uniref:reverse transcriptase domain-containing protein n=1 Tax=Cytophaga sp. TaxID=29535 RepID=UPI003F81AAAC
NCPAVSQSAIAYRKISIGDSEKNKSTIHFAHEVFEEIIKRSKDGECCVLKFDIKSFFSSLDHNILKEQWARVIGTEKLPKDHYNVFKAATRFSYIMRDDLRDKNSYNKKGHFNEKELARHRKKGVQAFFESPKQFREKIKNKELKIYSFPFRNKEGKPIGIPQGLPISAVLANIYLLDFDMIVVNDIVSKYDAFYRRYSDDIIVVSNPAHSIEILNRINELIEKSKLEISIEKTEKFDFRLMEGKKNQYRLTSVRTDHRLNRVGVPFTYLGFEFYGYKILVKSHNLAKFYRRLISSVKSKCNMAVRQSEEKPFEKPIIYRRQLYRLYTNLDLNKKKIYTNRKRLEKNNLGDYSFKTSPILKEHRSNYFSYLNRASDIMQEPAIKNQARNHMRIFNQAVQKHLLKAIIKHSKF